MPVNLIHDPETNKFAVAGDFLDIGIPNQDGLTFSRETVDFLLNDERVKDCLERRVFPAYLEHPKENIVGFKGTEAGVLTELKDSGHDTLYGKIELLDTDEGNFVRDLYAHGVKIGVSIRSDGYTDTGTIPGTTQGAVTFYGFDFVAEPAYKYAVPQQIAASRNIRKAAMRLCSSRVSEQYLTYLRLSAIRRLTKNLNVKEK